MFMSWALWSVASPHPLFDKVVSKLPELVAKFKKEPYGTVHPNRLHVV